MKVESILNASTLRVLIPTEILSTNAEVYREGIFSVTKPSKENGVEWTTLELDLPKTRMADSMGLNLLVSVIKFAKTQDGVVRLVAAQPSLTPIFPFKRVDELSEICTATV